MADFLSLHDVGMVITFAAAFLLIHRFRSQPRLKPIPKQAYCGAVIIFAAQLLTQNGMGPVALFFTPIAWTGYILWVDGAVYSLRGRSLLRTYPAEFFWLAISSILLWLIFEAYNLRLENWIYVGLPSNWWLRQFGYAWAFATIWPGIFETAMLLQALNGDAPSEEGRKTAPPSIRRPMAMAMVTIGLLMATVPLLVSKSVGAYLFGSVWLGFIFLLEPINRWSRRASLWSDLSAGDSSRLRALLWAGVLCGLWWEFWNWFAAAKWFYTVPILPDWKIFAMPLPGYLGFPAFAVECFVMFALIAPWLGWVSKKLGRAVPISWRVLDL